MAAFTSIVGAIAYAVAVQRRIHARNENAETPFELSIGDIAVSLGIRELCVGKAFHFDDLGNFNLKGLPTPAYGEWWAGGRLVKPLVMSLIRILVLPGAPERLAA